MSTETFSDQPLVELDIKLAFSEYLRANFWFMLRRMRILMWFLGIVVLADLVITVWLVAKYGVEAIGDQTFLLILVGYFILVPGLLYFRVRRNFTTHRALKESMHYSFSQRGLALTGVTTASRTEWENIRKVFETDRAFLLFVSSLQMYLLPKNAFPDEATISTFRTLLRDRLGDRKKVLYLK